MKDASSAKDTQQLLRVTIGISGWLTNPEDVVVPWRCLDTQASQIYALRWETNALLDLGVSLKKILESYAWSYLKLELLKRALLPMLYSALWPVMLLRVATVVDNPYSIARRRSRKAGLVLADALMNNVQGRRPVNLIGYGLGARVIYFCLMELSRRGGYGKVQDVYILGAPVPSAAIGQWKEICAVAAGRVVNGYSGNDWILGVLERGTSFKAGIAGIQEVKVNGLENVNLGKGEEGERLVEGHLRYAEVMGLVLKECGGGGLGELDMGELGVEERVLERLRRAEAEKVQEVKGMDEQEEERQIEGFVLEEERRLEEARRRKEEELEERDKRGRRVLYGYVGSAKRK